MSVADDLFESVEAAGAAHGFRVSKRYGEKHEVGWTWVFVLINEPKEPAPATLGVSVEDRVETTDRMG